MKAELAATKAVALACGGLGADAQRIAAEALELSKAVEIPVLTGVARCIVASHEGADHAERAASEVADLARSTRYVDGVSSVIAATRSSRD